MWSHKPLCMFSCHNLKWAWSDGALHSRWDPDPLKWEQKTLVQEHVPMCHCSDCFLPEQDFRLTLGRDNSTDSQKLRQCYSLATPKDHLTVKTVQLAQSPPWKINHGADGTGCWQLYGHGSTPCFTKLLSAQGWEAENEGALGECGWGTSLKGLAYAWGNTFCILGHKGYWSWWGQCWWSLQSTF